MGQDGENHHDEERGKDPKMNVSTLGIDLAKEPVSCGLEASMSSYLIERIAARPNRVGRR
jgi:hypothetical protein